MESQQQYQKHEPYLSFEKEFFYLGNVWGREITLPIPDYVEGVTKGFATDPCYQRETRIGFKYINEGKQPKIVGYLSFTCKSKYEELALFHLTRFRSLIDIPRNLRIPFVNQYDVYYRMGERASFYINVEVGDSDHALEVSLWILEKLVIFFSFY